jgi:hypothetical protein
MDKEGGDMGEIMQRVRLKTYQMREMIRDQVRRRQHETSSDASNEESTPAA